MQTVKIKDFHYSSKSGTDFILRPFFDGTGHYAGHDYLLAQIYGGSFESSRARPLFAVQVMMFPIDSKVAAIPPAVFEYSMAFGASIQAGTFAATAAIAPKPIAGTGPANYIDIHRTSPEQDNRATTHSVSWGLEVGADLGSSPIVSPSASYNQSKTWNVHAMEVYRHEFDPAKTHSTGVCWNLIFTQKDGMNLSSVAPRMDALFQCSKDKLRSGRFSFMLVERLIYWGPWNEKIDVTLGEATGIAAGTGAVPLGPLGAAFGAIIGAISGAIAGKPAISTADKNAHNARIDAAVQGDSLNLHLIGDVAHAEKQAVTEIAYFSLDFDNGTISTLAQIAI